ncbi:zinc ribbon domain-containing protein [Thermoflexus sp.]|uniref:zinc ribbon domain-containing protein n=1 Tax=Thermoflexus sp. TaxID=1969742 RepID=UPI0035E424D2
MWDGGCSFGSWPTKPNGMAHSSLWPRRISPSTRCGSGCGGVGPKVSLSVRVFRCAVCGLEIDRDLNAALNLRAYGLAALKGPTASSAGSDACGDRLCGGTGLRARSTSTRSMKQEVTGHLWNPAG